MIQKRTNKKGFSLIETIIYLAVFSMISLFVINSLLAVMSTFRITRTNRNLLEAGINSMERISREIRQSSSIDLANSNLGAGVLQLNSTDQAGVPIVIKFSKESLALNIYEGNILSGNLLGNDMFLENLIFRRINTLQSEAIKIEMSLMDINSKSSKIVNFYNTIILKGGY